MMTSSARQWHWPERPHFIAGSNARIMIGDDEPALVRLGPAPKAWPIHLSSAFRRCLLKANADASPILVDEFNAGILQRPSDRHVIPWNQRCYAFGQFCPAYCCDSDRR